MFGFERRSRGKWLFEPLETSDLTACADIHETCFSPPWSAGTLASLLSSAGMRGLAAVRNVTGKRHVDGFILYRVVADEAEVITIATAKSARRKGVGNGLMMAAIRDCLTDRVQKIALEVDESNLAARMLYASIGFRKAGERKGYYRSGADPKNSSDKTSAPPNKKVDPEPGNALIMVLELAD